MANNPQTQIDRIRTNVTNALTAIAAKGVTVGSDANSDNLKPLIESIAQGVFLPTLTNEGAAADLLSGKQLIDSDGKVVTGSMAEVTQATPSITVSTGGLITASATQSAGKVAAGTKSATQQMTTQAAQTITPGTTSKTIASGRYLTGTQTIAGDANLIAANIKQGVSIFGVAGALQSGGKIATGTISKSSSGWTGSMTASNVGFQPKQVVLLVNNARDLSYSSGRRYFLGGMFGDTKTAYLTAAAANDGTIELYTTLLSGATMSVSFSSSGFTVELSRTSSTNKMYWVPGDVAYIAIG